MVKADLQQIAESLNQAQDTYKVLLDKRNALAKSVEKLKLLAAWQVRQQPCPALLWHPHILQAATSALNLVACLPSDCCLPQEW